MATTLHSLDVSITKSCMLAATVAEQTGYLSNLIHTSLFTLSANMTTQRRLIK
ncbi:hypothetical protein VCR26J2_290056 [Vibrio coralliirubri]|nr:hypothetical protein VCR26J2_290056 [Vibrio coralliirubri]